MNVNSIVHEIFLMLSSDTMLVGSQTTVEKGAPLNTDPSISPWIDVIRGSKNLLIGRIGSTKPFDGIVSVNIFCQEFHEETEDSYATWERLEDVEERIISLVGSRGNLTLNGTVDVLDTIVSEPISDEAIDQRFLTNLITVTYRIRS